MSTVKGGEEAATPSDVKMNKTLLNSMSRRRMSCPQAVQQLWDAVKVIRYQRQVPSLERIVKYMYRVNTMSEEEVTRQLGYCVRDGLLVITKRKGLKGKKLGVEQEGYKLPDTMDSSDKHDWYCSECHIGGDVICCGGCWRVYHLSCINNLPGTKHKYLCSICQSCESEETLNIKQKRLNKLLSLACASLKDRYSFLVNSSDMLQRSINIGSPGAQIDIGSENWRTKYLISETMDIARMMSKSGKREYTHLAQFIADVHTIVHNVVIFHGVHSNMADNARQMLRDCTSEVSQIRACHTCYEASVTKPTRHWFCLPCKPPHTLVYAKAKGYSYWPAKVIKVEGEKYEVRFFGGAHCRATVDKSAIEPISVNPNSLQVKRSPSWSKACEELKRHQEMLAKNVNPDSSSSSDSSDESTHEEEDHEEEEAEGEVEEEEPVTKKKRGRGRPPKSVAKSPVSANANTPAATASSPIAKRKRGRPPLKKKLESVVEEEEEEDEGVEAVKGEEDDEGSSIATTTVTSKSQKGSGNQGRGASRRSGAATKRAKVEEVVKKEEKKEEKKPAIVADSLKEEEEDAEDEEEEEEEEVEEDKPPVEEKKKQEKKPSPQQTQGRKSEGDSPGAQARSATTLHADESRPQSPTTSSSSVAKSPEPKKNEEEIVSSSCMEPPFKCSASTQTKHQESKKVNKEVITKLKTELEELKASHAEQIKRLQQSHLQEIASTKKKQWCYNCEQEAIYHCCWNTAYCSIGCQQVHWQSEHKRVCRRKR